MRVTFMLAIAACTLGCPTGAHPPTVDADAAGHVVTDVCDLIDGIDDNGAIRSVCATVEEIITVVGPFVVSLLDAADAGPKREACATLPHTAICATSPQRAKAIQHLIRVRQARFMLDGGAR